MRRTREVGGVEEGGKKHGGGVEQEGEGGVEGSGKSGGREGEMALHL